MSGPSGTGPLDLVDGHFPWCEAVQNAARPRSLQLIGPQCRCNEILKEIDDVKNLDLSDLQELMAESPKEKSPKSD